MPRTKAPDPLYAICCEWDKCSVVLDNNISMIDHVQYHIQEYTHNQVLTEPAGVPCHFVCLWRDCNYEINGHESMFKLHVIYHGHHAKLKAVGTYASLSANLGECCIGPDNRNMLPALQPLLCLFDDCEMWFGNPEQFYMHISDCHIDLALPECGPGGDTTQVLCKWKGCDFVCKTKYKLKDHVRIHTMEKYCACPMCGSLFANKTKFIDHIKRQVTVGRQRQVYQCTHCSKCFSSNRLLRDHMRWHINYWKCPLCDMTCQSVPVLSKHIIYRHRNIRPYHCPYCTYSGKTKADIRRHYDTHKPEQQYKCQHCESTFKHFNGLLAHHRVVHQGSERALYCCHICEREFLRGHTLTNHLKVVHNMKKPPGHSRFRYRQDEEGKFRLQTIRIESATLVTPYTGLLHELLSPSSHEDEYVNPDSPAGQQDCEDSDDDSPVNQEHCDDSPVNQEHCDDSPVNQHHCDDSPMGQQECDDHSFDPCCDENSPVAGQ